MVNIKDVSALCEIYPFQVSNQTAGIHLAEKTTGDPSVSHRTRIEGIASAS